MAKPRIRHIALNVQNREEEADYYKKIFGMEETYRGPNGTVYLSDGHVGVALISRADQPWGINHFGFQVDDLDDVEQKLAKWNEPMTERPSTRPFAEHRAMDPDGNLFDISVHGYDQVELAADRAEKKKKVGEKAPA